MNGYFLLSCTIYLFTTTARAHTKAIRSTVRKYNVGEELYMDSINNSSMLELLKRIWRVSCDIKGRRHTTVNGAVLQLICTYSYIDSHSHITGLTHPLSPHMVCATTMQSVWKHGTFPSTHNPALLTLLLQMYAVYVVTNTNNFRTSRNFCSVQQKILIWIKHLHNIPWSLLSKFHRQNVLLKNCNQLQACCYELQAQ